MMLYNDQHIYLFVALFLLFCGIAGLVYRRTLIGMLVSVAAHAAETAYINLQVIVAESSLGKKAMGEFFELS